MNVQNLFQNKKQWIRCEDEEKRNWEEETENAQCIVQCECCFGIKFIFKRKSHKWMCMCYNMQWTDIIKKNINQNSQGKSQVVQK